MNDRLSPQGARAALQLSPIQSPNATTGIADFAQIEQGRRVFGLPVEASKTDIIERSELIKLTGKVAAIASPQEVKSIIADLLKKPNVEALTALGVGLSKLGIDYKDPQNQEAFAQADKVLRALYKADNAAADLKASIRSTLALANTFYLNKHTEAASNPNYVCDATEKVFLQKPVAFTKERFAQEVKALDQAFDKTSTASEKNIIASKIAALYYVKSPEGKEKAYATDEAYQALIGKVVVAQYSDKTIPTGQRTGGHLCFFHWENQCNLPLEQFKSLISNETLPTSVRAQLAIFGCDSSYGSKEQKQWIFSGEGKQAMQGPALSAVLEELKKADVSAPK